ncbi:amino acid permease [Bacillus methanolicus]|uniref:APC family permease n=1 Tax=Bacillus methanolicus TaxID=1471 RepID=UPI00200E31AD|nr:APC family permease [Bacillus methanolicus]UQD53261.1 amino acid permease [Bacillus methanolicus]
MNHWKRMLIGAPIHTKQLSEEKLTKKKALAIFSSDALSSVAYATEEILLVLVLIGTQALMYSIPIAFAIMLLLLIVTLSYRQIIHSFPSGGGAYIVAREHIGRNTSLTAGAALMIDYVLTVAVSICSGVAALLSAFPALLPYRVELAVIFVIVLMIINLRGIRESANIFAFPTYIFVASIIIMIGFGIWKLQAGNWHHLAVPHQAEHFSLFSSFGTTFLLLRAFASGCSALTGVEAISNGVPAFREPSSKNAVITMFWMSFLLGTMFLGITFLANGFGVVPKENVTVVSQIANHVFGHGFFYYFIQIFTMLILFLAANTAFAGFPQLVSIIAQDGFLPRNLTKRGDRLVFSNGIIFLSVLAILLIIIFQGETHALVPLYAVGVFLSFTIAQYGLIKYFFERKSQQKVWSRIIVVGIGMIITGIVTIITAVAKFQSGAWMVVVAIPCMVLLFHKIHRHYSDLASQLSLQGQDPKQMVKVSPSKVIIPISSVSRVAINSIGYAKSISNDVVALTVYFNEKQKERAEKKWKELGLDIPLVTVHSPYRSLLMPLLQYIDTLEESERGKYITVLIPQFFVKKWWHIFLHNQTAFFLRATLLWRKDIVVATIPYHLRK